VVNIFGMDMTGAFDAIKGATSDLFQHLDAGDGGAQFQRLQGAARDPFRGLGYGQDPFVRLGGTGDPFGKLGGSGDPFAGLNYGGGGGGPFGAFEAVSQRVRDRAQQAEAAAAAGQPQTTGGTVNGPSSGMSPGVAKWATQAQQVFGGLVDPDVMLAIMTNESGGDPGAKNPNYPAYGLFQLVGFGNGNPNWAADVDGQFAAARRLAEDKLRSINASYQAHGLNPDARTRARDFALAWAGHFDYSSGQPNTSSKDIVSGQTAQQLGDVFLANYDRIKAGRQQAGAGGDWGAGLLGTPYATGGLRAHPNSPQQGLDCSEFTAYVWGQKGVTLPWNAQQQYNQTARIAAGQLQPGDLVFFRGTNPADPDDITHVGIYVGNGRMINSQDNGVQYADLNSAYWQQHLAGYGRVSPPTGGGGANYR
jgi:hypothetical protein